MNICQCLKCSAIYNEAKFDRCPNCGEAEEIVDGLSMRDVCEISSGESEAHWEARMSHDQALLKEGEYFA